jgi:hypothetical protein
MGKRVPIEDRAVYCVQGYLTKKERDDFDKYCAKKKKGVSAAVALAVRNLMYNHN